MVYNRRFARCLSSAARFASSGYTQRNLRHVAENHASVQLIFHVAPHIFADFPVRHPQSALHRRHALRDFTVLAPDERLLLHVQQAAPHGHAVRLPTDGQRVPLLHRKHG